jgi:signal peptidase I
VADLRVLRDVFYIGALDVGARPGELIERERLEFPLEADQFFVLGDNSAASKDSRMWIEGHHVDRNLLIGKALAIFWPHAVPASWSIPVKIGGSEVRLPSWPNFARMGFVR